MNTATCSVDDCDRATKSRIATLCSKHHKRKWRHGDPTIVLNRPTDIDIQQWFWKQIDIGDPKLCWDWLKGADGRNYGSLRIGQKAYKAHRLAWEYTRGPIPNGLHVLHACDRPLCCNPSHLRLGNHQENMDDKEARGRGNQPRGADHHWAKLTEADVLEVRSLHGQGISKAAIARKYEVGFTTIKSIVDRKTWKHLP